MESYAKMLRLDVGIPANIEEVEKYKKAANDTKQKEQIENEKLAMKIKNIADNGNRDAMHKYGLLLMKGKKIPKDLNEAEK